MPVELLDVLFLLCELLSDSQKPKMEEVFVSSCCGRLWWNQELTWPSLPA